MNKYFNQTKRLIFIIMALTFITLPIDQWTKTEARRDFLFVEDPQDTTIYQGRREEIFTLTTQVFWMTLTKTYVRNHGASWGFLAGNDPAWRRPGLIGVGLVATMGLFYAALRLSISGAWWPACALCGLISGSFGNILDRLRYGYVVDFLTLKLGLWGQVLVLPTFNVADIIIVLTLILLIVTIVKTPTTKIATT